MAEMDIMQQFSALAGMQQTLIYVAFAVLGLLFFVLFVTWFVNRSMKIGTKFDFKGRSSGLVKKMPFWAFIFIKKEGGGVWVWDRWGLITNNGKTYAQTKMFNYKMPAPKFEDVFPGNFLLGYSANLNELVPLKLDQATVLLKASLNYDTVGLVYSLQRDNINTFSKQANWEKILPYAIVFTVLMGCLAMVFIVSKMQLDQMSILTGAMSSAADKLASAAGACNPPPPA